MADRALEDDRDAAADEAVEEASDSGSGGRRRLMITGSVGKLLGTNKAETTEAAAVAAPKPGVFLDLPDLLVNLNSTGRKASFLKISISLDLEDQGDIVRIQAVMPRIIDNFQVYLRELRVEDLRGSGGIYRLR